MKKLLLINPVGRRSGMLLSRFTLFPPLGLAYVAGATPPDWNVKILDENFERFQFEEADLVGITSFTATVNRAYEIARIYRDRKIKVIMGGVHASMAPEEALRYVDAVVIGEVENIWGQVLRDFEENCLSQRYEGPKVDLSVPGIRPRRDLLHPNYVWDSIQTSRGCPFNCDFCSVSRYLGKEYRKRDVDDVLDELASMKNDYPIFFLDDNLIGHTKQEKFASEELFAGMIKNKLNKKWIMQTTINGADDERLVEIAANAGWTTAFIGFETIDESTLRGMKKYINLRAGIESYSKAVKTFHKYQIGVVGLFVIGNDDEPASYYEHLADFMIRSGIDAFQVTILTPLPGTALMERIVAENRLACTDFPKDWDKFRLSYVVIRPRGTTAEIIYEGDNHIKNRLYSFPTFQRRMLRSLFSLRNAHSFYAVYKFNKGLRRSWQSSHYYKKRLSVLSRYRFYGPGPERG
ncbi:MAG: radical SAM protein [Syntrophorhabdales bacterium]